ncbi:HTH CENPB-type domain-containing protein [Trichonephila clavipes]|nr:HTH CENPB-type domain-containing protein [Trichonephila clavipes]
MFDIGESSMREWKKNEMTIINMPKEKCALRKGVTKWPILEESVANWVLENRQNRLIVTRNSVTFLFALKWSKKNANESKNLKAIFSWCTRFMARNNLVLREKQKFHKCFLKRWTTNSRSMSLGFESKRNIYCHILETWMKLQ